VKLRVASIAVIAALVVAGCGGSDEDTTPPPASGGGDAGKELFTSNCSSCHTLAAAGASGKVGPNLDQLHPGPDLVTTQVTNGGGGMPAFANKLSKEQIQQVADYVSKSAGKSH
jgi:mono/diheme cytochrome c family protein